MRPYRTVLEQKIKERHQTFEEFAESIETFAREHGEKGTIGVRHLHRLAAGRRSDGSPLGPVQPATARLLEHMLDVSIDELLATPARPQAADASETELRQRLYASSQVDDELIATLKEQLKSLRRLDRQLGAPTTHQELLAKSSQVTDLLTYSMSGTIRQQLAALLSEMRCLAGWQALDLGRIAESWHMYCEALTAARLSETAPYIALAEAGQAFVLADMNKGADAVEIITAARREADRKCSHHMRAWLAAAHGEVYAGNGQQSNSLRAFDKANTLLYSSTSTASDPYVALDAVHLARWRGHALARCGEAEAIDLLTRTLADMDATFVRAETSLRVDLAAALSALDERSAATAQADYAQQLAQKLGSMRQQRRLSPLRHQLTQNSGSA